MILVWGPRGDSTIRTVLKALERRNVATVFVDQGQTLSMAAHMRVGPGIEAQLELTSGTLDLRQVDAAFIRPHDSAQAPRVKVHGEFSPEAHYVRGLDDLLIAWAEIAPALVINRPGAMASNNSKPHQSVSARSVGFRVPETLITTDPEAVRQFAAVHGQVIYKSISGTRSIVTSLSEHDLERLGDVRWCPTQFQKLIAGTDVRVHVVGERVFPCEIESSATDYRYGESTMRASEVPAEAADRCIALARRLGLELAGIDLRRTPDGDWYCFEANPCPAFDCFGPVVSDAVAAAVVDRMLAAPTIETTVPVNDSVIETDSSRLSEPTLEPHEPDREPPEPDPRTASSAPSNDQAAVGVDRAPLPLRPAPQPTRLSEEKGKKKMKIPKVPQKTEPLAKFVRTGEGILVFAFNLALLIVPIVTNALSPGDAVKWAAILNGVAVVSRTGLKICSVVQGGPDAQAQQAAQRTAADAQVIAQEVVKQLPGVLKGTAGPDQVGSELASDVPDVEKLVSDLEKAVTQAG